MQKELIEHLIQSKNLKAMTEFMKIKYPDKQVFFSEYTSDVMRYVPLKKGLYVLCPQQMTTIQEGHLANALMTGELFDKSEEVENTSKFIMMRSLPYKAMCNCDICDEKLGAFTKTVVGKVSNDGSVANEEDIESGFNGMKDLFSDTKNVKKNVAYHTDVKDYWDLPQEVRDELMGLDDDIDEISSLDYDSGISEDDYTDPFDEDESMQESYIQPTNKAVPECSIPEREFIESYDPEYFTIQEGLFSRRPKKLKPIGRELVPYIITSLNDVQDSNDQAMLSGYICAKLELVDFYITVLDTKDARYIVPHNKAHLVGIQNQLETLLGKVLKIKPINYNDKVWKVDVNYPDGWKG